MKVLHLILSASILAGTTYGAQREFSPGTEAERINEETEGDQYQPDAAKINKKGIGVVWSSYDDQSDTTDQNTLSTVTFLNRNFDTPISTPTSERVMARSSVPANIGDPKDWVSKASYSGVDSRLALSWAAYFPDDISFDVVSLQLFFANRRAASSRIDVEQINYLGYAPATSIAGNGASLTAWYDFRFLADEDDRHTVMGRIFGKNGNALTDPFVIFADVFDPDDFTFAPVTPAVAALKNNTFAVVGRANDTTLLFTIVDGGGTQVIPSIQIASDGVAGTDPEVAVDPTGNLIVVWTQNIGAAEAIYGRRFSPTGVPLTPARRLSGSTSTNNTEASLAVGPEGQAVVAWSRGRSRFDVVMGSFSKSMRRIGSEQVIAEDLSPRSSPSPSIAIAKNNGSIFYVEENSRTSGDDVFRRIIGLQDNTDPVITVPDYSVTKKSTFRLRGTMRDESGIATARFRVRQRSSIVIPAWEPIEFLAGKSVTALRIEVPLIQRKTYDVDIEVADAAGNTTRKTVKVVRGK